MGKKGPTLFELMGEPRRPARPMSAAPEPTPLHFDEPEARVFGSSRALRVPMGYLFIAGAVAVAAMALAYSIGFQAGQSKRDRMDARQIANGVTGDTEPIRDPLLAPAKTSAPPRQQTVANAPPKQSTPSQATTPSRPASPIGGDPRLPDMNYFIVAYYGPELAKRAVEFLRANGVEAAAISANNGQFHYVVSLKPFTAAEVGSPAYEEHKSQLKRLGRIWKRDHKGPDDFSEVWAQKHRPSGQTTGRTASANDQ